MKRKFSKRASLSTIPDDVETHLEGFLDFVSLRNLCLAEKRRCHKLPFVTCAYFREEFQTFNSRLQSVVSEIDNSALQIILVQRICIDWMDLFAKKSNLFTRSFYESVQNDFIKFIKENNSVSMEEFRFT